MACWLGLLLLTAASACSDAPAGSASDTTALQCRLNSDCAVGTYQLRAVRTGFVGESVAVVLEGAATAEVTLWLDDL